MVVRLRRDVADRDEALGERREGADLRVVRTGRGDDVDASFRTDPLEPLVEARHEIRRHFDWPKIPNEEQAPANHRVVSRAVGADRSMPVHRPHFGDGKHIIYEGDVLFMKSATIHRVLSVGE